MASRPAWRAQALTAQNVLQELRVLDRHYRDARLGVECLSVVKARTFVTLRGWPSASQALVRVICQLSHSARALARRSQSSSSVMAVRPQSPALGARSPVRPVAFAHAFAGARSQADRTFREAHAPFARRCNQRLQF